MKDREGRPFPAAGLRRDERGVWRLPQERDREISYPEDGHDRCYAVEESSFWFSHRNSVITTVVRRFPPAGAMLDVGGGNGFVTMALGKAGFDAWLVEPGYGGCLNAVERGVETVVNARLEELSIAEGTVGGIGLFDVIEHLRRPEGLLREAARTLCDGGRLYVTVPAHDWLWSHADVRAGHFRRYGPAALRRALDGAGLETEYHTFFFSFMAAPLFIMRTLPHRLGLGRTDADEKTRLSETRADHAPKKGPAGMLMEALFKRELAVIDGSRMGHGTSLLAVGRRR
ncbi:MAG TPA: class I SAM-dependent methyltransferase [Deltaproteobacteria bacterium]|nr:class I SAM-dependent methyltransferase [Deltaproteobacteria bacterium]